MTREEVQACLYDLAKIGCIYALMKAYMKVWDEQQEEIYRLQAENEKHRKFREDLREQLTIGSEFQILMGTPLHTATKRNKIKLKYEKR